RFGKLRMPHVDVFNYEQPETSGRDTANEAFGLLQKDGTIRRLNMKLTYPATDAVMFFGRISLSRDSVTTLDDFSLHGFFNPKGRMTVNCLLGIDSMTLLEDIYLMPNHATEQVYKYDSRLTAENHTLK